LAPFPPARIQRNSVLIKAIARTFRETSVLVFAVNSFSISARDLPIVEAIGCFYTFAGEHLTDDAYDPAPLLRARLGSRRKNI
jgi:hypothetical protein